MLDVPHHDGEAPHAPPCNAAGVPQLPPQRGFWRRIADRLLAFVSGPRPATPPERSVAFTIAIVALGAKLDGEIARSEVAAFRRIFVIPRADERNAARVFDLARQTTLGFEEWARRIARMFPRRDPTLADVFEGLCMIAAADGALNPPELAFMAEVGAIFGLPEGVQAALIARHDQSRCVPCSVLGVSPDTSLAEARDRWRELVREAHPDRAIARGLPPEAVRLAAARTRRLNEAWQQFRDMHKKPAGGKPAGGLATGER